MSKRSSGWSRKFEEPIALAGGRELITLHDAADYITAVCTENLNPNVLTMKSAQYRARIYDARSLNLARDRRILVQ